ncbi:HIRAN domain-containing protein [Helicobacter ganmani]|uniref:HIRAN domain-containing protein n=1 Tax=Helicobacter ganmani TaxID=60246 RepID=UPI0039EA55A7
MFELIVAWQNQHNREWIPIGRLRYNDDVYAFSYTKGAKRAREAGFKLLPRMNTLEQTYYAPKDALFPSFANRLLTKSRPEYKDYKQWLSLDGDNAMEELAKNNGIRATDSIQLYAIPQKKDNQYKLEFFSHGISHLSSHYQRRVAKLETKEKLFIAKDIQNEFDNNALLIRTKDPVEIVGYIPRIYTKDISYLLDNDKSANLEVKQINKDAPMQFQLLCNFNAKWNSKFKPFGSEDFEPLKS